MVDRQTIERGHHEIRLGNHSFADSCRQRSLMWYLRSPLEELTQKLDHEPVQKKLQKMLDCPVEDVQKMLGLKRKG